MRLGPSTAVLFDPITNIFAKCCGSVLLKALGTGEVIWGLSARVALLMTCSVAFAGDLLTQVLQIESLWRILDGFPGAVWCAAEHCVRAQSCSECSFPRTEFTSLHSWNKGEEQWFSAGLEMR